MSDNNDVKKLSEEVTNEELEIDINEKNESIDDKKKVKKSTKRVASVLTVLIIIVVVASMLFGKSEGIEGSVYRISSKAVGCEYGVLYNQKAQTKSWEEKGSYVQNFDRSAMVYCTSEGSGKKVEIELWYIDNKIEPVKFDSLNNYVSQISISDDGKYILYVVENDEGDGENADIYIYNVAKQESTVIAKDVVPDSVVASPDCKTAAYVAGYSSKDDNKLYVAGINKEPVKIAKDGCYPMAITNNGKNIIYCNYVEDKLFYYNGKEAQKISAEVKGSRVYVNCSEDEIVYERNGKTYCYKAGDAEANKLYSSKVDYFTSSAINWSGERVKRLSIDTFADAVFVDYDYRICMITDKRDDVVKINSDYEDFSIAADGKAMVYAEDDTLFYVKKLAGNPEGEAIYSSDKIKSVITNSDLSKMYIVNEEDELIYVTKSGKYETICNDLDDIDPVVCESNGKIYFVEDGDLYEAETSKKSKVLVKSGVIGIQKSLTGICYGTEEETIGFVF